MTGMSIKCISVLNLCHALKPFVKSTPGLCLSAGPRAVIAEKPLSLLFSVCVLCVYRGGGVGGCEGLQMTGA